MVLLTISQTKIVTNEIILIDDNKIFKITTYYKKIFIPI